jgi:4-amino-4-deoxychorismate lyase
MSESINRAFMYGESVFTTMRMVNSHVSDWDFHFDRLKKGLDFVYGPFPDGDNWALRLKNRLEERLDAENGDHVIRLTLYREQARGLISTGLISVNDLKINLSASHYDSSMSDTRLHKLRICTAVMRPQWWPDFLKAGSYLETILAQKVFMKPGDDDVLFLSPKNTILSTSMANIFMVRENKLFTAPTGPNVLAGIMRKKVIHEAHDFFAGFKESETNVEQLGKVDAVFGTNSVKGLFLVDRIDDFQFQYSQAFLANFEALRKRVIT